MTPGHGAAHAPTDAAALAARFIGQALQNDHNRAILERLPSLDLPDAWLVAGCLFQTVWNLQAGRMPTAGIKDYDIFYFDACDLSEQAETAVGQRVDACLRSPGSHDSGTDHQHTGQEPARQSPHESSTCAVVLGAPNMAT